MSETKRDELHAVNVVVDEGKAFLERHPDIAQDDVKANIGALWYGLLRAVYECPGCPGHFRVPITVDEPGDWIACPHCHGTWVKRDEPATPEKPKSRGRARR